MALKPMKGACPTSFHKFLFLKMKACLVNFSEIQTLTGASSGKLAGKAVIEKLCYCVFAHFAVFRTCYTVLMGPLFALNYPEPTRHGPAHVLGSSADDISYSAT